eukprot:COSAG01_NODE_2446_length_7684_cov_126.363564_12_plen_65_part_00
MMSRWLVGSLETTPAGTPGPRTYLLRNAISKYGNSMIRNVQVNLSQSRVPIAISKCVNSILSEM